MVQAMHPYVTLPSPANTCCQVCVVGLKEYAVEDVGLVKQLIEEVGGACTVGRGREWPGVDGVDGHAFEQESVWRHW